MKNFMLVCLLLLSNISIIWAMEEGYCQKTDPLWIKIKYFNDEILNHKRKELAIDLLAKLTVADKFLLYKSFVSGNADIKNFSPEQLYELLGPNKDKFVHYGKCMQSLFHVAVQEDKINWMFILIAVGAEAHVRRPSDGKAPLHLACMKKDVDMIKLLVWAGGQKNSIDSNGNTPAQIIRNHLQAARKNGTHNDNDRLIEQFIDHYGWS